MNLSMMREAQRAVGGSKMNKEKQIEEFYELLTRDCETSCCECKFDRLDLCLPHRKAEALYNAGYRKASDVAREIFEELERNIASLEYRVDTPRKTARIEELKAQVNWVLHEVVPNTIAELKKKYTEGKEV